MFSVDLVDRELVGFCMDKPKHSFSNSPYDDEHTDDSDDKWDDLSNEEDGFFHETIVAEEEGGSKGWKVPKFLRLARCICLTR